MEDSPKWEKEREKTKTKMRKQANATEPKKRVPTSESLPASDAEEEQVAPKKRLASNKKPVVKSKPRQFSDHEEEPRAPKKKVRIATPQPVETSDDEEAPARRTSKYPRSCPRCSS